MRFCKFDGFVGGIGFVITHRRTHPTVANRYKLSRIAKDRAANQISKKLKFGFAGNHLVEEFPPQVVKRLGGTLDEVIARLGDLTPLFEEAQVFSKI